MAVENIPTTSKTAEGFYHISSQLKNTKCQRKSLSHYMFLSNSAGLSIEYECDNHELNT